MNYNIDKCRLDVEKMADEDIKPLVTDWGRSIGIFRWRHCLASCFSIFADESLVSRELDARKSVTGTQEDFAGESTAQIREDLDLEPARESDFDVPDNVEYPEPPPPQPRRQEEEVGMCSLAEKLIESITRSFARNDRLIDQQNVRFSARWRRICSVERYF